MQSLGPFWSREAAANKKEMRANFPSFQVHRASTESFSVARAAPPTMSLKAALMVIATAALFQFSRQSARDQVAMLRPATTMTPDDSGFDAVSSTVDWEGERSRVWFGSSPRAEVYGWPAEGGMLALQASPVELEFLGLGRLKPTLHPNSDDPTAAKDEEEHCNKSKASLLVL